MAATATARSRARGLGGMGPFLFAAAAMFTAMYSTQAILPALGRRFDVSPSQAGLTVSVVIGSLAVGAWFWGPLSDRIGRRASLVLSSAVLVVPSLCVAVAPTFVLLLAARAAQGLCMPGLLTVGVPYVTEAYSERMGARAMGLYVSSLVVGGLVGRVGVALLTAALGWRAALAIVAALPLAATVVMRRSLPPESAAPSSAGLSMGTLRSMLANRALVAATLAGAGLFFAFMGAFSYIDFRLEGPPFHLSPAVVGLVFVLWATGAVGPAAGRLAGRRGWQVVALAGLASCVAGLTLSLVDVLGVVIVGLAMVTLGNFSAVTAAQLGVAGSTERDRGMASALYFCAYYVAGALGCYVPGLAWQAWGWTGVWAMCVAAYALGLCAIVASRMSGRRSPDRDAAVAERLQGRLDAAVVAAAAASVVGVALQTGHGAAKVAGEVISWAVWAVFAAEAATMLTVTPSPWAWARAHAFELVVLLVAWPVWATVAHDVLIAEAFPALTGLEAAKLAKLAKAARIGRVRATRLAGRALAAAIVLAAAGAAALVLAQS